MIVVEECPLYIYGLRGLGGKEVMKNRSGKVEEWKSETRFMV
jgi:hypothetical protein